MVESEATDEDRTQDTAGKKTSTARGRNNLHLLFVFCSRFFVVVVYCFCLCIKMDLLLFATWSEAKLNFSHGRYGL